MPKKPPKLYEKRGHGTVTLTDRVTPARPYEGTPNAPILSSA